MNVIDRNLQLQDLLGDEPSRFSVMSRILSGASNLLKSHCKVGASENAQKAVKLGKKIDSLLASHDLGQLYTNT